jgi:hypothetical protein
MDGWMDGWMDGGMVEEIGMVEWDGRWLAEGLIFCLNTEVAFDCLSVPLLLLQSLPQSKSCGRAGMIVHRSEEWKDLWLTTERNEY